MKQKVLHNTSCYCFYFDMWSDPATLEKTVLFVLTSIRVPILLPWPIDYLKLNSCILKWLIITLLLLKMFHYLFQYKTFQPI
jgi:hypothetical protein